MEDKEKQIEEMAKILKGYCCLIGGTPTKGDCYQCQKGFASCFDYAKHIYNAGYRKIDKEIVLSREEYKQLLDNAIRVNIEYLDHELAQARKETAEKILDNVFSYMGKNQNFILVDGEPQTWLDCLKIWEFMLELAKQFGVEIKE